MAQVPFLIYDQKPPMSSDAFKSLAQSLLNKKDADKMRHLSLDPDPVIETKSDEVHPTQTPEKKQGVSYINPIPSTGCGFIDNWREWERTLRLNLAKYRAHSFKRDNEITSEPPVVPTEAANTAAKAVAPELSPLDAEILIDKARWSTINQLAGQNYFGINNVYAYYLKLVLMERKMSFNTEKGFSEYKSLYAEIVEKGKNLPTSESAQIPGRT
jgi:hypothetical protein